MEHSLTRFGPADASALGVVRAVEKRATQSSWSTSPWAKSYTPIALPDARFADFPDDFIRDSRRLATQGGARR